MNTIASPIPRARSFHLRLAMADLQQGLASWRIWWNLGWQDIRLRYRRSQLGPLWITLSTAIMIYSMGFLYSRLFKIDLSTYYPYLATGLITWTFISSIILEANDAFVENAGFIKQTCLPFSIYILRLLMRNFIILLHNILPVLPILIYFKVVPSFEGLFYLIGGLILFLNIGFSFGFIFALLGSRFRDMKPIVASLVQVCFLLTPILWQHAMLSPKLQAWMNLNPFYQLIQLLRAPLLGEIPSLNTVLYCLTLAVIGWIVMAITLARCRHRIAFWV